MFTGERHVDLDSITAGLGTDFTMLSVMFRMYDSSGYNQPVIDLMSELRRLHAIDPAEVEEVVIFMNYLETLYPSPEFPRFADPSVARRRLDTVLLRARCGERGLSRGRRRDIRPDGRRISSGTRR